jgi:hypothetical protein
MPTLSVKFRSQSSRKKLIVSDSFCLYRSLITRRLPLHAARASSVPLAGACEHRVLPSIARSIRASAVPTQRACHTRLFKFQAFQHRLGTTMNNGRTSSGMIVGPAIATIAATPRYPASISAIAVRVRQDQRTPYGYDSKSPMRTQAERHRDGLNKTEHGADEDERDEARRFDAQHQHHGRIQVKGSLY